MEQTATFISVLKAVAARQKFATDLESLPSIDTPPFQAFAQFIEKRVREGHEYANWRELILTEQRTSDANGIIAFNQYGKTRIGKVVGVYVANPETTVRSQPKRWIATANGIQMADGLESTELYVQFRKAAPRFTTTYYQPTSNTYQDGDVVFWPMGADEQLYGDCYEARLATATTFEWVRQEIPLAMANWVIEAAFADALIMDGQRERGYQHLSETAYPELRRAALASTSQQGVANAPRIKVWMPS